MVTLTFFCIGAMALAFAGCSCILWREIEKLKEQSASMALEIVELKKLTESLAEETAMTGRVQQLWSEGFNNLMNYSLEDAFKAGGEE